MATYYYATGFERNALSEYSGNVGSVDSLDSTVYKNGSQSMKSAFTTGTQNGQFNIPVSDSSLRKVCFRADVRFSGYPPIGNPYIIYSSDANNYLQIASGGVLQLHTSTTTTNGVTTLSLNTFYQIELIVDKDWPGATYGAIICRLNGVVEATYNLSSTDAVPSFTNVYLSMTTGGKSAPNPGITCWYDNLVVFFDTATTQCPWIGSAVCEEISRVPVAMGHYNDWTGTPDNTNQYNNLKESPSDGDTSYDYVDVIDGPGSGPAVAINTTAGNLNGTYHYQVTYINATGETIGSFSSAAVAPANQQVDLTSIPTDAAITRGITGRKIYRTIAGGSAYFYVATINDDTTMTYTDNLADASLGAAIPTTNTTGTMITTRQSFKYTNVAAYTGNIIGACLFFIRRTTTNAGYTPVTDLMRDNSVDYPGLALNITSTYTPYFLGNKNRPGGGAWTASVLNSLEGGGVNSPSNVNTSYENRLTASFMVVVTDSSNSSSTVSIKTLAALGVG